ncbi:seven-hairpin glycosidase [Coniochaeta ligniaria NRRL 30616]|uniref:alpha-1,2-Mannosidase n=1 Tax=Coniochaeta ligniaria NRRL 30616 TaxID=1408157 RepID=A0A1J7IGX0_9PEZI|nr:seven-hairpin glycosidase [Coniochaeta ligniaria NRRL 30616]
MPRFRRYRLFLVCAFVILVLLFQVGRNSNWEPSASLPHNAEDGGTKETNIRPPKYQPPAEKVKPDDSDSVPDEPQRQPPSKEQNIDIPVLKEEEYGYKDYALPPVTTVKTPGAAAKNTGAKLEKLGTSTSTAAKATKPPALTEADDASPLPPKKTSTTAVHWQKQPEHFPIPPASLIPLPTGSPLPMPPIQAIFAPESPSAKATRERRLAKVKSEAQRAWQGYKTYAWTHDEVQPLTKKPRDPFCGWAATLVDALDTLWIMGMREEFDDAVAAVGRIDFTTTPYRTDIPVFETIIRYLGGLLAAYDVSGGPQGKYKVLLDKALELAEILMGTFDTPNRMPVLYYNWKPEYASQPHRASASASVAELGSMSMEFTRLAQVTGEDRFYDAVARITDAFEEWSGRGTALDGIFPQNVDASGCNRTALNLRLAEERSAAAREQERLEAEAEEGEGEAQARAKADRRKRGVPGSRADQIPALLGRDPHAGSRQAPLKASGALADWDCPAQGLVSGGYGADSYSMGGSQDSAYEYFPKQYLLLGGLEPKYRTLHEKTVKAVKKYLLYRPMIEDESRDLLFSARAYSYGKSADASLTYDYEVTHLTCFLGGMFGLGGKIFGSEEDVEIGKKLADGCAWAYEIMPTGIMPESAIVMPCESVEKCAFNETAWFEKMDPSHSWREEQMRDYLERHKLWEEEVRNITEQAKELDFNTPSSHSTGHRGYDAADGSQTTLSDELDLPFEPMPPQTHEEYVKDRIRNEHLPKGFVSVNDKRYILRPEAIESVWYMYRITGDPVWQEKGWRMFESIIAATSVSVGHSAIDDVSSTKKVTFLDNMESFWLAETLKYFYLLFATPDTISLDEWVFNTEAHPFRRPS